MGNSMKAKCKETCRRSCQVMYSQQHLRLDRTTAVSLQRHAPLYWPQNSREAPPRHAHCLLMPQRSPGQFHSRVPLQPCSATCEHVIIEMS